MVANFTKNHPEAVKGLALWAAFTAQSDDLSDQDLAVTSIYAIVDGLTSIEDYTGFRGLATG